MLVRKFRIWYPYYDGEGGGEGQDTAQGGSADDKSKEGKEGKEGKGEEKRFTQKELDEVINKRFSKEKKEKETLLAKLRTLEESTKLSEQERGQLSEQITKLEESLMTKDELLNKQKLEAEKKHQKDLEKLSGERDTWKNRYESSTIERALSDAAVSADALNPKQIQLMFRGSTRLVEQTDESGKAIGAFTPHLKFLGYEDEKKEKLVELELPVEDAIKKLKLDGLNANLFKHGGTGGTGKTPTNGQGGKGKDPDAMPTPEDFPGQPEKYQDAYQTWRNTHNVDGTKRKKPVEV